MRNRFAKNLLRHAKVDEKILLITGDLGYGVLDEFASELPGQFINAGIAEQTMMGMAAGIASTGYRPFVYSIANFPTIRCLEQIRNDVCYMNNPVTIVAIGAGFGYGNLGYTHHAIEDIAVLRSFQNLVLYSPCSPNEVDACIIDILANRKPAYLRLGKGGENEIYENKLTDISKPLEIHTGTDGYIVFSGGIVSRVLDAQKLLNQEGLDPTLISLPKISQDSIDELIENTKNSYLLSVEEHVLSGGIGSWILERVSDTCNNTVVSRIGIASHNISLLGSQNYLLDEAGLSSSNIYQSFKKLKKSFIS